MSLFIKSKVHLPSNCEKCPFNYADMSVGICIAADKTIDTRTYGRKRHPDCPMTELPTPHGRLIDADKLSKKLERYRDMCGDIETQYGIDTAIRILNNTPTIIEAEESE